MEYAINRLTTEVSRPFKQSHISTLIEASYSRTVTMSELFRVIAQKLRDDQWIVVFKALSLIHILLREGNSERILGFLCGNVDILYQSFFKQHGDPDQIGMNPSKYIKSYSLYLEEKAGSFRVAKYDWVKQKDEAIAKFRSMENDEQLLKDTEMLQKQTDAAIGCNWDLDSVSDIVLQQGFRYMISDSVTLFLLGLYFAMNRQDATKALVLYKNFVTQTKKLQELFQTAKDKLAGGFELPKFQLPPSSLVSTLENYLRAPDFEEKRSAYKARTGKSTSGTPEANFVAAEKFNATFKSPMSETFEFTSPKSKQAEPITQKERPLIDFFSTLEEDMVGYNAPRSPPSNGWDDQFSQQTALQNDLHQQMQATNQLLNSNNNAGNGYNPYVQAQPQTDVYANNNHQNQQVTNPFSQNQNQVYGNQSPAYNPFLGGNSTSASGYTQPVQQSFQKSMPYSQNASQMFGQSNVGGTKEDNNFNVESVFGGSNNSQKFSPNSPQPALADPFASLMKPQATGGGYDSGYMNPQRTGNGGGFGNQAVQSNHNPFATQPQQQFGSIANSFRAPLNPNSPSMGGFNLQNQSPNPGQQPLVPQQQQPQYSNYGNHNPFANNAYSG